MVAKKLIKKEENLSANDLMLKRYLELDQLIKQSAKELEALKSEIKHSGGLSTRNYVATVTEQTRTSSPPLKTLVEIYGEKIKDICTISTFKIIKVSKKGL